jgi:drug/metabolite transporter (DMT)-like permease
MSFVIEDASVSGAGVAVIPAQAVKPRLALRTVLAGVVTVVLWASAFAGIRMGLGSDGSVGYGPAELACLRFTVAALGLAVYACLGGVRLPAGRDLPAIILVALVAVPVYHLLLNFGEVSVAAGPAAVLINTSPIFTALLAMAFLGERLRLWGWIGIGVCFGGAVVIAMAKPGRLQWDPRALLILGSALSAGVYTIMQKPLLRRYSALELTSYLMWFGALTLLLFMPHTLAQMRAVPPAATLAVVYLGIFPAALAYVTWAYVLARMPASVAATLTYLIGPLSFIIAWVWLGEVPAALALAGAGLVIVGVVLVNRLGMDKDARAAHGTKC